MQSCIVSLQGGPRVYGIRSIATHTAQQQGFGKMLKLGSRGVRITKAKRTLLRRAVAEGQSDAFLASVLVS